MVELVSQPIDAQVVLTRATSARAGAVVLFLGTTREFTGESQTTLLEYDCYSAMAEKKLRELELAARTRWPVEECVLVHRLGVVPVAEASVAIAVSTPHRRDAYEASQWLIDRLKEVVPIWKKEHWSDGTSEWQHPNSPNSDTCLGIERESTQPHKTNNGESV